MLSIASSEMRVPLGWLLLGVLLNFERIVHLHGRLVILFFLALLVLNIVGDLGDDPLSDMYFWVVFVVLIRLFPLGSDSLLDDHFTLFQIF